MPRTSLALLKRASLLCCSLICLLLLSACGEKALVTVPTESEAIEILTILRQNGIGAEKQEAGDASAKQWSISVSGADYDLALRLMAYYELPRVEEKPKESGLLPYETEQQAEQRRDSERQIRLHLCKLNGVVRASVTISPAQDPSRLNPYPAKADVSVTHKESQPPVTIEDVQKMVASSYPTLTPENVYVKLQHDPLPVRREVVADRRNYMIFAIGLALVAVLTYIFLFLLRKARRQRSQLGAAAAIARVAQPVENAEDEEQRQMVSNASRPGVN